jgi:hypothetical protein
MTNAEFEAQALAQPYVEFVGARVFHLVVPVVPGATACGTWASVPRTLQDGRVCTTYIGGCPFPAFVAAPSRGRHLCGNCRKVRDGQRALRARSA